VQNSSSLQSSTNFNINGTGKADIFDATTRYNINGNRVLSAPGTDNLFAGVGAGAANTGLGNAFFGKAAGQANTLGAQNSFFGNQAGANITTGGGNSFFGSAVGLSNTIGGGNSFFGGSAGHDNTTGSSNAFFGSGAGQHNTTGLDNSAFGGNAGFSLVSGNFNTLVGNQAGASLLSGMNNTFIGASTFANGSFGDNNTLLGYFSSVVAGFSNATAIGARAEVSQGNSLVLGSINGVNGATADTSVGIGTSAPKARLDVVDATSAIRFGATTADEGGYLASFGPSVAVLAGGARFNGSTFTAKSTTSSHITLSGGKIRFYSETDLTPGSIISLNERMTIDTSGFVGIGTSAPVAPLHVVSGSSGATPNANASLIVDSDAGHFVNILGPDSNQTGVLFGNPSGGGSVAGIVFNNPAITDGLQFRTGGSASTRLSITSAGDVGIGTGVPSDKLHVIGIIRVETLGSAGGTSLCRNASNQIATCSSSLRYK